MNERTNKRSNERTNERINERTNKRTIKMNERTNERTQLYIIICTVPITLLRSSGREARRDALAATRHRCFTSSSRLKGVMIIKKNRPNFKRMGVNPQFRNCGICGNYFFNMFSAKYFNDLSIDLNTF